MKIAIIGAGNMGGATARGIAAHAINPADIYVSNPSLPKLEAIRKDFPAINITQSNTECVKDADMVVLAVKPWKIEEVAKEILPALKNEQVVIGSLAAGISLDQLNALFGAQHPLYVILPNTAIAVRQSMTFIAKKNTTAEMDEWMVSLFKSLGDAMLVEERLMGAGMALASCGIAYVMRYIRAATEGGVELGMYAHDAQRIIEQTMRGAVELLEANGSHPETEIDKVTTPGGYTIQGLNAMEAHGFTNSVIQGLKASIKRKS